MPKLLVHNLQKKKFSLIFCITIFVVKSIGKKYIFEKLFFGRYNKIYKTPGKLSRQNYQVTVYFISYQNAVDGAAVGKQITQANKAFFCALLFFALKRFSYFFLTIFHKTYYIDCCFLFFIYFVSYFFFLHLNLVLIINLSVYVQTICINNRNNKNGNKAFKSNKGKKK